MNRDLLISGRCVRFDTAPCMERVLLDASPSHRAHFPDFSTGFYGIHPHGQDLPTIRAGPDADAPHRREASGERRLQVLGAAPKQMFTSASIRKTSASSNDSDGLLASCPSTQARRLSCRLSTLSRLWAPDVSAPGMRFFRCFFSHSRLCCRFR